MEAGTVVVSKGEPRPALGCRLVGIEIDFGPLPLLKEDRGTSTDKSQRTDPAWIREGGEGRGGLHPWPGPGQPAPVVERRLCFQPPGFLASLNSGSG